MNEEMTKILKLIEDGKITADQGAKLLEAMQDTEPARTQRSAAPERKNKILRVIVDAKGDGPENAKVRINVPLEVAKKLAGFTALVPREAREEMLAKGIDIDAIDLEGLINMFQDGLIDENLVDIQSGDSGKGASVKVYVD